MSERNVPVRELEEGNEILVRAATGEWAIVEDVRTAWVGIGCQERTTVTLIDGRSITLSADRLVTAFL